DPVEFGKAMGALVKEATAPLLTRIDQLEKQLGAISVPTAADAAALIDLDAVAKSAAALVPKAENGTSVAVDDVRPLVDELIAKAVAALPAPEKGKDADMDALKAHVGELVKGIQPVAPLPVPSVEEIAGTVERRS